MVRSVPSGALCGIGVLGSCPFAPIESMLRYFAPSSVLILMSTRLWLPTKPFLTVNVTFTQGGVAPHSGRSPPIATSDTLPTFTPAMRTSLSALRFADSVK